MKADEMLTNRTTRIAALGATTRRVNDSVRVETAAAACEDRQR
jgi:hypothetical protein